MKKLVVKIIRGYQQFLSFDQGYLGKIIPHRLNHCVFYPTCSDYVIIAIEKYGLAKGFFLGLKRILRCHPWQQEHIDFP